MDFIRLAVRDVKRNGSRTAIGIAAMALATIVLVLSRVVPKGYVRNQAIAERVFAGADILVWSAPAHVRADSRDDLEWRRWEGEEWQSFAEYFMPSLFGEGYVCPAQSPPWQPLDEDALSKLLAGVDGVDRVEPYLSYPCRVVAPDAVLPVILRGRVPDDGADPPHPLAMEGQVESGRGLRGGEEGAMNAVVPLVSEPRLPYIPQGKIDISLPRGVCAKDKSGLDWAEPARYSLTMVGGYTVRLGDIPGMNGPDNVGAGAAGGGGGTPEPVYWKRPEIVVSAKTFTDIVGSAMGAGGTRPPVYQLMVRVIRPSEIRSVTERIREAIGPGYAAYAVAELARIRDSGGRQQIIARDMSPVITGMIITMAAAIVAGSSYVMLAQETQKIGLLRVIGATSRDILIYVVSVIAYTTLFGAGIGFAAGKLVSLTVLPATDFTFQEWLSMTAYDALLASSSLAVSLALGAAVAFWASRIPCAEVLRRE